jgi:diguanylate cyclase (GGDEF)-like protein/PAS domain S-box-containing protein
LAAFSVLFTRFTGGVALIWPVTGLLIALLVREQVRRWPLLLLAAAAGLIAQGVVVGPAWQIVCLMEGIRLTEPLIAALILCPVLRVGVDMQSVRGMTWFVAVAGVLAPTLSGVPAAWIVMHTTGTDYSTSLVDWSAAHGLGALIFTPICCALVSGGWRDKLRHGHHTTALKTMLLLALAGLISWQVFAQSAMPLLFLPLLPIAYTTLHGGRAGAVLGLVVLAVVGTIHTAQGHGPVFMMHGSAGSRWLFFQAYVASATLLVLPIAALLAERAKLTIRWRESEARYRSIAESLGDAVTDVGPDGTIRYASPAIYEIAGVDADHLIGRPARELVCRDDLELVIAAYMEANEQPGIASVVQYRGPADGEGNQRWYEASMRALRRDGRLDGVLSSVRDITKRKAIELSLARAADLDPLTGLPNRRSFMRDLEKRCAHVSAGQGIGSVALLDLDHFKAVNDCHGHAVGDAVLKGVADAIAKLLRAEDRVARIGGEEFAFLLCGAEFDAAVHAAERLRAAVGELSFAAEKGTFKVTASLGLARLTDALPDTDALKAADVALYKAKAAGRNCLRVAG